MKNLETVVMIPTFNEAGNIKNLIKEVLKINSRIACLVVDDNSPDGTGEIVDELAKKYPNKVFAIHRYKEKGRASAGIRGFKEALKLKPQYIAEMDADFSHRPQHLREFLKVIQDYDVILGSRFVKGGQDINRGLGRKFLTFTSRVFLSLILGVKIQDIGSGFKLYKRTVIESLNLDDFFAKKGVAISLELNFRIIKKGYKIREMPIIFQDRKLGKSKLRWQDFIEPVIVATRLSLKFGRAPRKRSEK